MWKNIVHEQVFKSLLLEAKSPEEILRLIKYRYKDTVPEWFVEKVFSIDPTKRKSFTQWACNKYHEESGDFLEALNNGTLKKVFDFFQKNANTFSLADMRSLDEAIGYAFTVHLDEYLRKNGNEEADDFEYTDVDSKWGVAQYHTYEASLKLGKDCIWCTANWYGNGYDFYEDYTTDGRLFVLIDKSGPETCNKRRYAFKRYQMFFDIEGNKESEFRDSKNNSVLPGDVGFTKALFEYFNELGFSPKDEFLSREELAERYDEWRESCIIKTMTIAGDEYVIMPEYEANMDIRDPNSCFYCIFPALDNRSEINGSPYEQKSFYVGAEIFTSRTFTVLESDNEKYVWQKIGEELWNFGSMFAVYGDEGGFSFYWDKGRVYFENETTSWLINSPNVDPGSISIPKQKHDGGIHFNLTTSEGNTYLLKLLPHGEYSIENYVTDSVFVLDGDEYVSYGKKDKTNGLVGGKYVVLNNYVDLREGCRFFPCKNEFSESSYNINVYDEEKGSVVFPDDKCYESCYCEDGIIWLHYQKGANNYSGYTTDLMDMKTGKMLCRGCTSLSWENLGGKYVLKDSDERVFFINTLGENIEKFECDRIISNDSILWFVNVRGRFNILFNLKDWEYYENVKEFLTLEHRVYCLKFNNGDVSIAYYNRSNNKLEYHPVAKIDGNIYKINTKFSEYLLLFKCVGNQKMSLYSPRLKKFILKDYLTDIEMQGPFSNSSYIAIFDGGAGFQVFNISNLTFVGAGMRFRIIEGSPTYSEGTVSIAFKFDRYSISPLNIKINGSLINNYTLVGDIYYGTRNGRNSEICDKQTYEIIQSIRRRIEGVSNEQVNESFSEKFYTLLDRMEMSKYNWV